MKIIGIDATLPSKVLTNQNILSLIEEHSKNIYQGDLQKLLRKLGKLFAKNGIQTRRWLAPGEVPMDLLKATFDRALRQANIAKQDIDLLIYPNVSRGFTEPANSAFVAKALGLNCRNYDVIDACMGWVTAMDAVDNAMYKGRSRYAAIVNLEFLTINDGPIFPKNFQIHTEDELAYKFPSFTMGEAVSVTILSNDEPENFDFSFVNRPDLSHLCTISLSGWKSFCNPEDVDLIEVTGGAYQFNSRGGELHRDGEAALLQAFAKSNPNLEKLEHVFTHTSSLNEWNYYARQVGVAEKIYPIAHESGNVITASIPVAMVDAIRNGALKRDQNCLGWNASAGMVFAAMKFCF